MDDATLLRRFESCELPPDDLRHRDHVQIAWLYLRSAAFEDGAVRFCHGLRRYAAAHGKTMLYHETITWAFLALVNERVHTAGAEDFEAFAAKNADLFEPGLRALDPFYEPATRSSELARRVFLLPRDRPSR